MIKIFFTKRFKVRVLLIDPYDTLTSMNQLLREKIVTETDIIITLMKFKF